MVKKSKEVMREPGKIKVLGDLSNDKVEVNERIRENTVTILLYLVNDGTRRGGKK